MMDLSKNEIFEQFRQWVNAWNEHDLERVMDFIHESIVFENWDDKIVNGKDSLRRVWLPWFIHHGNFRFIQEDLFFDVPEQKVLFQWRLEWPSPENKFKGQHEIRRGVDILHLKERKIIKKTTYSKISIQIGASIISMQAV